MALSAKQREIELSMRRDALVSTLIPVAAAMIRADKSASVLIRAAKVAYLAAAISEMHSRNDRPSVSRLSVVTGMTRKEVSALLRVNGLSEIKSPDKQMEHRALRVLRGWKHDPLYTLGGRPCELPMKAGRVSFASLVRAYGGDVPAASVLRELEQMKAVRRTSAGGLRLLSRASFRKASSSRLEEFTQVLADFSETASQLLTESGTQNYFGFKELPNLEESQIARFKESFRRRAATLLEGVELWGESLTPGRHSMPRSASSRRIGLGVYLVDVKRRR